MIIHPKNIYPLEQFKYIENYLMNYFGLNLEENYKTKYTIIFFLNDLFPYKSEGMIRCKFTVLRSYL